MMLNVLRGKTFFKLFSDKYRIFDILFFKKILYFWLLPSKHRVDTVVNPFVFSLLKSFKNTFPQGVLKLPPLLYLK